MKKITLLLITLFSCVMLCQAQVATTAADYMGDYTTETYSGYLELGQFTTNGNTFDCTALVLGEPKSITTTVPPSELACSSDYPQANYCSKTHSYSNNADTYKLSEIDSAKNRTLANSDGTVCTYNGYEVQFPVIVDASPGIYSTLVTPIGTFNNVYYKSVFSTTSVGWSESKNFYTINPLRHILSINHGYHLFQYGGNYFLNRHTETLGIEEQQSQKAFFVFPNPTQDDFTIHYDNKLNVEAFVSVYDILGKELVSSIKANGNFNNISLKDFSPGLYIVKITNEENQVLHTEKIIKK